MRAINLFKIELPNKSSHYIKQRMYLIGLGNGAKRYFSNLKEAKAFMTETNRFLNDRLHELNYQYGVIFSEYRKVWFYLSDNYETRKFEAKIIECFSFIDKFFMQAGTRSGTINGNYFVFNYLFGICEHLMTIIDEIINVLKQRHYSAEEKRVDTFKRQIVFIKSELDNFGKVDPEEKE
jgi:hypothetical protein